jgi:hypothetical protein
MTHSFKSNTLEFGKTSDLLSAKLLLVVWLLLLIIN